jgi:hypothetical protein
MLYTYGVEQVYWRCHVVHLDYHWIFSDFFVTIVRTHVLEYMSIMMFNIKFCSKMLFISNSIGSNAHMDSYEHMKYVCVYFICQELIAD